MLEQPVGHHLNGFSRLKETPGPANLKHLRLWIDRLAELDAVLDPRPLLCFSIPMCSLSIGAG
jgi:hypothetical protein